jgi:hypothetical protein
MQRHLASYAARQDQRLDDEKHLLKENYTEVMQIVDG